MSLPINKTKHLIIKGNHTLANSPHLVDAYQAYGFRQNGFKIRKAGFKKNCVKVLYHNFHWNNIENNGKYYTFYAFFCI